jgi:uncharacterized protein
MYSRSLRAPETSFFLFGPRGTGKSTWLRTVLPHAFVVDLLHAGTFNELLADPSRLESRIPRGWKDFVVIDEVQKAPALLDEVHRLIEKHKLRFALTGSSARKLKRQGVNLLAGRARTLAMHPLTTAELGADFDLKRSLQVGRLPEAYQSNDAEDFLNAYVQTYLREEIQQEGLVRNLAAFARFQEAMSFSQGALLNVSEIARTCSVERKVVENYVSILEDLMLGCRLTAFTKRAKREQVAHPKFYFFDVGVYRAIRPRGPLDSEAETDGPAIETLLLQELRAINEAFKLRYSIHFWRTRTGDEVDFVLYGEHGFLAIEVKRSARVREEDLRGLRRFGEEYPKAQRLLVYGGDQEVLQDDIRIVPLEVFLRRLPSLLGPTAGSSNAPPV